VLVLFACTALGAAAWVALTPISSPSRDEIFEIPPSVIRLTLGVKDVLVLRNLDDVPQIFGPALMMPGQSLRLPFEVASSYQFACTAHASGQMTVIVEAGPTSPWARLRWRFNDLLT
jgi:hypothetical protein